MEKIKSNKKIIKIAAIVAIAAIIVIAVGRICAVSYEFGYRVFTETAIEEGEGREIAVSIPEYMSSRDVGALLEEKGLLRDGNLFWIQLQLSVYKNRIHSGDFTLKTSMTPKEIMQALSEENTGDGQ